MGLCWMSATLYRRRAPRVGSDECVIWRAKMSTRSCGCKELVLISKLPSAKKERLPLWPQAPLKDSKQKPACLHSCSHLLCQNSPKHGCKALDILKMSLMETRRPSEIRSVREDGLRAVGSVTQFRGGHSSPFVVQPQLFQSSLLTPTPLAAHMK